MTTEALRQLQQIPFVFIAAKERSGTTLLQVMLQAHSQIIAPPESRFIILLYRKYGKIRQWTEQDARSFCEDLFREKLFREHWNLEAANLLPDLLAAAPFADYPLMCRIVYRHAFPEKQAAVFVDKNPVYYFFLDELETIFPGAKFIHLVNDYRANIVSHRKVFRLKNVNDIAYKWLRVNRRIEAHKERSPQRYHRVRYEDLVASPEATLRGVCTFLGLPYEAEMAQSHETKVFHSFDAKRSEARFSVVHGSLFRPLDPSMAEKWKKELTPAEVKIAEGIAGEYAEAHYGYPRTATQATTKGKGIAALKFFAIEKLTRLFLTRKLTSPLLRKTVGALLRRRRPA